jgi:hypothetical protein
MIPLGVRGGWHYFKLFQCVVYGNTFLHGADKAEPYIMFSLSGIDIGIDNTKGLVSI